MGNSLSEQRDEQDGRATAVVQLAAHLGCITPPLTRVPRKSTFPGPSGLVSFPPMDDNLPSLPRIASIDLRAAGRDRMLDFYTRGLGLALLDQDDHALRLGPGTDRPLLTLHLDPSARPAPGRTTGLYHFAILLPSRRDLARALRNLLQHGYPLQGAADHLVSEALYLADPEGNGIELYADRPRADWPRQDGKLRMATDPLDFEGLMAELSQDQAPWSGMPSATVIGHVHLKVAGIEEAESFYQDLLGFDLVTRYGASASFLSTDGYHHHVGLNSWESAGAPPPPDHAAGLLHFSLNQEKTADLASLHSRALSQGLSAQWRGEDLLLKDPSGNVVLLLAAKA